MNYDELSDEELDRLMSEQYESMSDEELDAAINELDFSSMSDSELDSTLGINEKKPGLVDKIHSGAMGVAHGLTYPVGLPHIAAAIDTVGHKLIEPFTRGKRVKSSGDYHGERLETYRDQLDGIAADAPAAFGTGQFAGAMMSSPVRGVAKGLGKLLGPIGKALSGPSSYTGSIAKGAAIGATEGTIAYGTGLIDKKGIAYGALGGGIGGGVSRAFSPQAAKRFVGKKSFERIEPLPVKVQEEIGKIPGGATKVGDTMLEAAGTIPFNSKTAMVVYRKISKMRRHIGKQISQSKVAIDEALTRAGKNSIPANDIRNRVINHPKIKEMLTSKLGDVRVKAEKAVNLIDEALGADPYIKFSDSQKIKRALDQLIPEKLARDMTLAEQGLAMVRGVVNQAIDDVLENSLRNAGPEFTDLANQFRKINIQYRRLSDASDIISNKAGGARPGTGGVRPIDIAFASSGSDDAVRFGATKTLSEKLLQPLADLSRSAQMYFSTKIAAATDKLSPELNIKLSRAAQKGSKAFLLQDKRLMKTSEEYRNFRDDIIQGAMSELGKPKGAGPWRLYGGEVQK